MLMNDKITALYDFEVFLYDFAIRIRVVHVTWLYRKIKIVRI